MAVRHLCLAAPRHGLVVAYCGWRIAARHGTADWSAVTCALCLGKRDGLAKAGMASSEGDQRGGVMTRRCRWLNERHKETCVAESLPGDAYCAAHRALTTNGAQPQPPIDRTAHQDADLLPFTNKEFFDLAYLRKRTYR